MRGTILGMQLMLPVVFVLADGLQVTREVVVDTGFTGGLSLPTEMVQELGLTFVREHPVILADGNQVTHPLHAATIQWHIESKNVAAFALGDRPLLGTALLEGSRLDADFKENGTFTVVGK